MYRKDLTKMQAAGKVASYCKAKQLVILMQLFELTKMNASGTGEFNARGQAISSE
jgi:hypothetical protein